MGPNRKGLLLGTPAESPVGSQVAGCACEREGRGRGFIYGRFDYHENILIREDYGRFVLNGIIWPAGLKMPVEGIEVYSPPGFFFLRAIRTH